MALAKIFPFRGRPLQPGHQRVAVAAGGLQKLLKLGNLFLLELQPRDGFRVHGADATPELIDYPGGGSAKEWTSTLDSALQLDFDNVVPGHGIVTTKAEMRKYRDSTPRLRNRVHELIVQKKSRTDIEKAMRAEFHWADLHVMLSLDGAIAEMQ